MSIAADDRPGRLDPKELAALLAGWRDVPAPVLGEPGGATPEEARRIGVGIGTVSTDHGRHPLELKPAEPYKGQVAK